MPGGRAGRSHFSAKQHFSPRHFIVMRRFQPLASQSYGAFRAMSFMAFTAQVRLLAIFTTPLSHAEIIEEASLITLCFAPAAVARDTIGSRA